MVEAFTGGLAGYGRADLPEGWGANVMVRLTDPAAFGGSAEFNWQTDWLVDVCHDNVPRVAGQPVRLPGERGLARKAEQLATGVALHPSIMPALGRWPAAPHRPTGAHRIMSRPEVLLMSPLYRADAAAARIVVPRSIAIGPASDPAALVDKVARAVKVVVTSGGRGIEARSSRSCRTSSWSPASVSASTRSTSTTVASTGSPSPTRRTC